MSKRAEMEKIKSMLRLDNPDVYDPIPEELAALNEAVMLVF